MNTTYTPYPSLPDPQDTAMDPLALVPGILLDLTADNRTGTDDITLFFGLLYQQSKKVYASSHDGFCRLTYRDEWEFSAEATNDVFMIRGLDAIQALQEHKTVL